MSYNYRISKECTEWASGKPRTFARWSRNIWEQFADYGRTRIPNACVIAMSIIEEVAIKDAEVYRAICAQDAAEIEKAQKEGRPPVLVAGQWVGMESRLWDKALLVSNRYLSAGSPELQTLLQSTEGEAYITLLLLQAVDKTITEDEAWDVFTDLKTNPCTVDEKTGMRADDGRRTLKSIFEVCQGIAPESIKNADSPGE